MHIVSLIVVVGWQVTVSNGMTWSLDKKHFYYVDSLAYCIYQFDYNDEHGTISKHIPSSYPPPLPPSVVQKRALSFSPFDSKFE